MQGIASLRKVRPGEMALAGFLLIILVVLIVYPLGMLLYGSVRSAPPGSEDAVYTLQGFARIVSDPQFYLAWRNTLIVSFGAAAVALVFGLAATFLIVRTDMPGRRLAEGLIILPIFISPFIGAVAWSGLGAPRVGVINRLLDALAIPWEMNIYSLWGIAFVLGFYMTPYVFLFTSGPMSAIDSSMEEASRLSGRNRFQTILRITLPLITPSILACALLVVVLSMENFGVLAVLGMPSQIPLIPIEIFTKFSYPPVDYSYATVISLSLVGVTALGLYLQRRVLARRSYAAIAGRGYRARRISLGPWRWAASGALATYIVISTVLPFAVMVLASFQAYWTQEFTAFTLENYRDVFTRGLLVRATQNSFMLGFFGAFVATALAVSVAYVSQRSRVPGRALLDVLGTISVGIPGIVLGVALLWAWINVPLAVYGTLWILLIAYVTRFLSFGVRNVSAALTQVGHDLEAAARVAGASKRRAAMTVTLPLVKSNILSSWVIYFISFIKELNTSVLLYSFSSVVRPVVIFDSYVEGHYQEVAALATGITAVVFLVLITFSMIFRVRITPRA